MKGVARGSLRRAILAATDHALACGALLSIPTECQLVSHQGVEFLVRVVANLGRKDRQRRAALDAAAGGAGGRPTPRPNPFLPYEEDLFVADLGRSHVGLLNRFNVVDHHLLMVTRDFEDQTLLLSPDDMEVLWACLQEMDGLGFYNGGEVAGASQPHRHLQLVPLPLSPGGAAVPVEPLLSLKGRAPQTCAGLPFAHAVVSLGDLEGLPAGEAASLLQRLYLELFQAVGLGACEPGAVQPGAYNLLATRRWMMMVPRRAEHFRGVSFNALAFAGSLFVRNRAEFSALVEAGPMNALCAVAGL